MWTHCQHGWIRHSVTCFTRLRLLCKCNITVDNRVHTTQTHTIAYTVNILNNTNIIINTKSVCLLKATHGLDRSSWLISLKSSRNNYSKCSQVKRVINVSVTIITLALITVYRQIQHIIITTHSAHVLGTCTKLSMKLYISKPGFIAIVGYYR